VNRSDKEAKLEEMIVPDQEKKEFDEMGGRLLSEYPLGHL
jgi:hypothetical protein